MFLQKLEIELPYDLAVPPLGRNPSQHRAKRLTMLISIQDAVGWGRCPSAGEWVEKTGVYNQCGDSA